MAGAPSTGARARVPWGELFRGQIRQADSGCWEWTGKLYRNGYGCFGKGTRSLLAHRVAFAMFHGECPAGAVIRHRCDNRKCVNPWHLAAGTHADNSRDAWQRNRIDRANLGAGRRRIAAAELPRIRRMRDAGMLCKDIAVHYGVRANCISRILSGTRRLAKSA